MGDGLPAGGSSIVTIAPECSVNRRIGVSVARIQMKTSPADDAEAKYDDDELCSAPSAPAPPLAPCTPPPCPPLPAAVGAVAGGGSVLTPSALLGAMVATLFLRATIDVTLPACLAVEKKKSVSQ